MHACISELCTYGILYIIHISVKVGVSNVCVLVLSAWYALCVCVCFVCLCSPLSMWFYIVSELIV